MGATKAGEARKSRNYVEVRERSLRGEGTREIARALGVSPDLVRHYKRKLRARGVEVPRDPYLEARGVKVDEGNEKWRALGNERD